MKAQKPKRAQSRMKFSFYDDFPEYFEVQPGKGQFSDAKFQQISVQSGGVIQCESDENGQVQKKQQSNEVAQNDGQFHVDEGIPYQNASSIKTYQFNSGLFAPSKIDRAIEDSPPEVQIKVKELYGHNSKYRMNCVIIDEGCYCVSIGCSIVLCSLRKQQKAKQRKMYQQHQFEVCQLFYSKQYKTLVSGSKGLHPQIIVWSYEWNSKFEECLLSFVNRFHLPRKSEAVGLLALATENILVCVDAISIHRSNSLYLFDIQAGNQLQPSRKVSGKIYDIYVRDGKEALIASDRVVYKMSLVGQKNMIKFCDVENEIVSVDGFKDKLLIGDRLGNILVISNKGKIMLKINVHKCCVYLMKVIAKSGLVVSSQVEQNVVKIQKIVENGANISLQNCQSLQFNSYCTAIDYLDGTNVLICLRDGNVILYNPQKKLRKFQKKSAFSYLETRKESFFLYNTINERLILMVKKKVLCQISLQNLANEFIITEFRKRPNCIWLNKDKMIKIFQTKDAKLQAQIYSLTSLEGEPQQQIILQCPQSGKPEVVRFNDDVIAIGTKLGFMVVHCIKNSLTMVSTVAHKAAVQQIIFQDGEWKEGQKYFLKSVCESELYYWQLEGKEGKIKKLNKAWAVKNVQWCGICKYGWETRSIWEEMTHYEDICSVALVSDKFLCISMWNGVLRVYRYPASPNNYVEFKLFPGKFLLAVCGNKESPLLGCLNFVKLVCAVSINDEEQ